MDPPDEFQFPPKRVVEPSDQMGGTNLVVPVPDPKMEDLSNTPRYPQDLPGTPPILPPAEARSEDGSELPDQVEFPADTGSDGWAEWDDYPLGGGQSGDEQPPESRPQFETLIYIMLAVVGRAIARLIVIQERGARTAGNYIVLAVLPPAGPIMDRRERRRQEERMQIRDREMDLML